MKSTFLNMVLVLLIISLVAAGAVGGVNLLTKNAIEKAAAEAEIASLAAVLPEFDNAPMESPEEIDQDGARLTIYTAKQGDVTVGYAVKTSANGFAGAIGLMVGFKTDGEIINIVVLSQSETPGLGAKIKEEGNPVKLSFVGKNIADLRIAVKKDGGDIEAITASTISSRAYTLAVKRAYDALVAKGVFASTEQPADKWDITQTETGFDVVIAEKGFNGDIKLAVSFAFDGTITDIVVLEHNEDRSQAVFDKLRDQLVGKNPAEMSGKCPTMTPSKDGGDIDTTSGATISSRAYLKAVATAAEQLKESLRAIKLDDNE